MDIQQKVTLYTDFAENLTISRLQSYLAWRQNNITVPKYDENGVCKMCKGNGVINTRQYGIMRCICQIHQEEKILSRTLAPFRSPVESTSLEELVPWGNQQSIAWLVGWKKRLQEWASWPQTWITLIGSVGCGKTHMLSALADIFGNWGLYITVGDFQQKLSEILDGTGEVSMSEFIDTVKRAPFLFLDDLGAEYAKVGKDYTKAQLRTVIDFRYMMPTEYITVVATNLTKTELPGYDMRIADRILDEHKVIVANVPMGSWRRNADRF